MFLLGLKFKLRVRGLFVMARLRAGECPTSVNVLREIAVQVCLFGCALFIIYVRTLHCKDGDPNKY